MWNDLLMKKKYGNNIWCIICTFISKFWTIAFYVQKTWSILTDRFSQVFGRIKLNKKGSRNIYVFLLKKVIAILRSISRNALVSIFLCQILLFTNAVLESWPQKRDNFLK